MCMPGKHTRYHMLTRSHGERPQPHGFTPNLTGSPPTSQAHPQLHGPTPNLMGELALTAVSRCGGDSRVGGVQQCGHFGIWFRSFSHAEHSCDV